MKQNSISAGRGEGFDEMRELIEWSRAEMSAGTAISQAGMSPVIWLPLPATSEGSTALQDEEIEEVRGGSAKRPKWGYYSSKAASRFVESLWRGDGLFSALENALNPSLVDEKGPGKKFHGVNS